MPTLFRMELISIYLEILFAFRSAYRESKSESSVKFSDIGWCCFGACVSVRVFVCSYILQPHWHRLIIYDFIAHAQSVELQWPVLDIGTCENSYFCTFCVYFSFVRAAFSSCDARLIFTKCVHTTFASTSLQNYTFVALSRILFWCYPVAWLWILFPRRFLLFTSNSFLFDCSNRWSWCEQVTLPNTINAIDTINLLYLEDVTWSTSLTTEHRPTGDDSPIEIRKK